VRYIPRNRQPAEIWVGQAPDLRPLARISHGAGATCPRVPVDTPHPVSIETCYAVRIFSRTCAYENTSEGPSARFGALHAQNLAQDDCLLFANSIAA
jgi:hypothetical protein